MCKKFVCLLLCAALLASGMSIGATAAKPTDSATLSNLARLFYAVAGERSLSAHEIARADVNRNGNIDLQDVTQAFYRLNGQETATVSVAFDMKIWDLDNTRNASTEPFVLESNGDFAAFVADNPQAQMCPDGLRVDFSTHAVIVVPFDITYNYVANVTTDDDTVYVSVVSITNGLFTPNKSFALLTVAKEDIDGKDVSITRYTTTSSKRSASSQTMTPGGASFNGDKLGATCRADDASLSVSYTMPSGGYTFEDLDYVVTDDAFLVICSVLTPRPDDMTLSVIETISASMPIAQGDYHGQPIVLVERFRVDYRLVVGTEIPHKVVFEGELSNASPAQQSEAVLITSYDALIDTYSADAKGAPDYTAQFDEAYFEDHALILVKAYYHVLPHEVHIDGVGVQSGTLHVMLRYTNKAYHLPMLYHGRFLVEIPAREAATANGVRCDVYEEYQL